MSKRVLAMHFSSKNFLYVCVTIIFVWKIEKKNFWFYNFLKNFEYIYDLPFAEVSEP